MIVTDGVFSADDDDTAIFHPALNLDQADYLFVQKKMRHRGLPWLLRHGHLDSAAVHVLDAPDHAITFMRNQRMANPDKPFFVYFAPGAVHGPHQVAKEWADKYAGKFDQGWDELRKEIFKRQKKMGIIPANAKLTDIDPTMQKWKDVPKDKREFQTRLMEVYAGFLEHTDVQYGRIIDELENLGVKDNTLIIYINGDNGSSAEGGMGSISELLSQNGMPSTLDQHIEVLNNEYGGMDALG